MSAALTIVTNSLTSPGAKQLLSAAQSLGRKATVVLVGSPEVVDAINNAESVIFRVSPRTYSTYADFLDLLNPKRRAYLQSVLDSFDKQKTYEILRSAAIPTPESYVLNENQRIEMYPAVIKIARGNQGKGVALIRSAEDLVTFKKEFPDEKSFLVQEYIAESSGNDRRLFIVGDRCVAAMQRNATGSDFRANVHLGGTIRPYVPSEREIAVAIAAVKAAHLPFAGVDIIQSNQGPLVLELNPSPGFAIQAIATTNIAEEIIKTIETY